MYVGALKALLGVRETTRTDVILIETGMPTLKELISLRIVRFMKKNIRSDKDDTPLAKAYKMCEEKGTSGYRYIKRLLDSPEKEFLQELKQKFLNETGKKSFDVQRNEP